MNASVPHDWALVALPAVGVCLFLGLGQGQGMYKLRVSEWSCVPGAGGVMIARGTVVNQSGQTLKNVRISLRVPNRKVYGTNSAPIAASSLANGASSRFEVRVRPTQSQGVQCQVWFRSPEIVQIPTQVPGQ